MNWMLERSGGALVRALMGATLAVTLAAVMLALFPAVAEAQAGDKSTSSVVVQPGDSLWSISEERLGPNAAPQRIVEGAEQIYALNSERIGPDPNLILVGQELLVPRAMSERPTGATPAPKTAMAAGAAEAGPRDRAAKGTGGKAPKPAPGTAAVGGADAGDVEASEPVAQRASLPGLPDGSAAATVPAVRAVASNDAQPSSSVASFLRTVRTEVVSAASALAESFFGVFSADTRAEGRRLLGVGVLALTLVVTALMAWKLPMRRTTRGDAERWGTSSGYYGYYGETPAHRITPFAYHPGSLGGSLGDRDEQDARREAPRALGRGRRAVLMGSRGVSASIVRKADTGAARGRAPKARAVVPRNGLALGAHNPRVRRAPRRVHATMRARILRPRLRPRRGAPRRPMLPAAVGQTKGVNTRAGR